MVRLVEVVLKPGKRACPPFATPAAEPGAGVVTPLPGTLLVAQLFQATGAADCLGLSVAILRRRSDQVWSSSSQSMAGRQRSRRAASPGSGGRASRLINTGSAERPVGVPGTHLHQQLLAIGQQRQGIHLAAVLTAQVREFRAATPQFHQHHGYQGMAKVGSAAAVVERDQARIDPG